MKNYLFLVIIFSILFSCSNSDDNTNEQILEGSASFQLDGQMINCIFNNSYYSTYYSYGNTLDIDYYTFHFVFDFNPNDEESSFDVLNVLIIGTKDEPYKPKIDPYNRAEIKPEKDYIVFILDKIENNICHYSGQADVYESEIENIEW